MRQRTIHAVATHGMLPVMANGKAPEEVLRQLFDKALDVFKGPFGSLRNFLEMVALPNCVDYFQEAETESRDAIRREQTRHLFNATVSLDSAVDYMFSEQTQASSVTALIASMPSEIGELREIANALKHCVRGRNDRAGQFQPDPSKTAAKAVVRPKFNVTVKLTNQDGPPGVKVDVSAELLAVANKSLAAAFAFWCRYVR